MLITLGGGTILQITNVHVTIKAKMEIFNLIFVLG